MWIMCPNERCPESSPCGLGLKLISNLYGSLVGSTKVHDEDENLIANFLHHDIQEGAHESAFENFYGIVKYVFLVFKRYFGGKDKLFCNFTLWIHSFSKMCPDS